MRTLILTLAHAPHGPHSNVQFVVTDAGQEPQDARPGPLASLPRHGKRTIALVPPQRLSWHRLVLPKNSLTKPLLGKRIDGPRLRQVLDGMLEDQLLDEPQHMHLALEPGAREGVPVWVCACDARWLQDALALLETAGIRPQRICPEFVPASIQTPPAWNFLHHAQQVWAVHTSLDGVAAWPVPDQADAAYLAQIGLEPGGDALLVAEPALSVQLQTLCAGTVQQQSSGARMQAAAQSDWNLAQFELAPRSRSARQLQEAWDGLWQLPALRPLRWSLLALLVVNLGGLQWSAWQAQTAMQTQRAAMAQVLTQTFPQVQVVVDAPLQMERQVQTLLAHSGAVSAHDFEAMAKALGAVLPPDTVPAALDFAPGELRAAGLAPDPQMLATARAALSSQGYSVEQAGGTLVIRLRSTP